MKGLDAWITGNYGENHPDNQPRRCPVCEREDDEDARPKSMPVPIRAGVGVLLPGGDDND